MHHFAGSALRLCLDGWPAERRTPSPRRANKKQADCAAAKLPRLTQVAGIDFKDLAITKLNL